MVFLVITAAFAAGLLLTAGLNWLALIPWRRSAGQHWTERARLLWPVRIGANLNTFLMPVICILAGGVFWQVDELSPWLPGGFGWLGAMLGNWFISREVMPWADFTGWAQQTSAIWLLHLGWLFLFLGGMVAMPDEFGWPAVALGAVVLLLQLSLSAGLASWLLRRLRILSAPPERLQRIVAASAVQLNAVCPPVWVLPGPSGYAAALIFIRQLIFSQRLLDLQPDDEISAICAHEMGHLAESRSVLAGRLLASLWMFPLLFLKPALNEAEPPNVFAALPIFAAAVGLLWFGQRLARKMEVRADQVAKASQSADGVYARALARLYENNQVPAVMRGNRKVHPHLYDRMLAAGITPDFPRPKPPGRFAWNNAIATAILIVLFCTWSVKSAGPLPEPDQQHEVRAAVEG